jgi:hypothetical protein
MLAGLGHQLDLLVAWMHGPAGQAILREGIAWGEHFAGWVVKAGRDLLAAADQQFNALRAWMGSKAALEILAAAAVWSANFVNWVVTAGQNLLAYQVGVDLVQGLKNGLASMAGSLASTAKNLVTGSVQGVWNNTLGRLSPSKWAHDFGADVVQGAINGMNAMAGALGSASRTMAATIISAATAAVAQAQSAASSVTGAGSGPGGFVRTPAMIAAAQANPYTGAPAGPSAAAQRATAHQADLTAIAQAAQARATAYATDIANQTTLAQLKDAAHLHDLQRTAAIDAADARYAANATARAQAVGAINAQYDAQRITDARALLAYQASVRQAAAQERAAVAAAKAQGTLSSAVEVDSARVAAAQQAMTTLSGVAAARAKITLDEREQTLAIAQLKLADYGNQRKYAADLAALTLQWGQAISQDRAALAQAEARSQVAAARQQAAQTHLADIATAASAQAANFAALTENQHGAQAARDLAHLHDLQYTAQVDAIKAKYYANDTARQAALDALANQHFLQQQTDSAALAATRKTATLAATSGPTLIRPQQTGLGTLEASFGQVRVDPANRAGSTPGSLVDAAQSTATGIGKLISQGQRIVQAIEVVAGNTMPARRSGPCLGVPHYRPGLCPRRRPGTQSLPDRIQRPSHLPGGYQRRRHDQGGGHALRL